MQLIVALIILGLDQISKAVLAEQASLNRGIAYGWLADRPAVTTILVIVALVGLGWYRMTHRPTAIVGQLGWTLLLTGVASNLIDRIRIGAVIDPLSVGAWFPNFNLADASIIVGLILLAKRHPLLDRTSRTR